MHMRVLHSLSQSLNKDFIVSLIIYQLKKINFAPTNSLFGNFSQDFHYFISHLLVESYLNVKSTDFLVLREFLPICITHVKWLDIKSA